MANVVELNLRQRDTPLVWQCQCGGFDFWLYSDGLARCTDCKRDAVTMQGAWQVPAMTPPQQMGSIHHLFPALESDSNTKTNSS